MSDPPETVTFDEEAQEPLLDNDPAQDQQVSDVDQTTNNSARLTWTRLILLLRSTELFKLGATNGGADVHFSSPDSASYASITSSDDILISQGTGNMLAFEVSGESTHVNVLSAHPSSDDDEHTIDLQQRENIVEIVKNKNLQKLRSFGGVRGVAEALNTDLKNGIPNPQETCQFKRGQLSQFLLIIPSSFLKASNNYTIFLLFSAAALSLGFGIKEEGLHMGWFNGAVLLVTVLIIVTATTIHNSWQEWSRRNMENCWQLRGRKMNVKVVRGGEYMTVSQIDLEVGDVAFLQKGDQVPADGLVVTGEGLELNDGLIIDETNPFMFYGSRVINGYGRMVVTSTGMDTAWGEMMSQAKEASAESECQFETYLHKSNKCVQIVGLLIAILIIVVFLLRDKLGKLDEQGGSRPDPKAEPTHVRTIVDAIEGIITGSKGRARVLTTLLSVSLLGIMEGIPFAISLAALNWSSRTLADKACERDAFSCIKMACVTTICTDKFGGITEQNKEIDKFYVGEEFVNESSVVASQVLDGLCDGIGSQFLLPPVDQESSLLKPLLVWAKAKLGMREEVVIEQCTMKRDSGRNPSLELCRVLMEKKGNGGYLHCKGPAHDIVSMCSHQYYIDGEVREIDEGKRYKLDKAIRHMQAEGSVEVIAFACKRVQDFNMGSFEQNSLILLAMISVKETTLEETKRAVTSLKEAGIRTILASVDNIPNLKTIGQQCGLITDDGSDHDLVLPVEEFRAWTDQQRLNNVEKIAILGNCLPSDELLLVRSLKEKGQVVAVVAQQTVDAPTLNQADIGITYGTWSSEVARECSNIIIWHGNSLNFLVNIINNGRCFQQNIRKFIQLQLILTISGSLINFVAIVRWGDAPITAVQLFWLSLVVGLVGGLALLTGPPTTPLMTTQPSPVESSSAKLITKAMWRNIAIQVSYQTTILLTLQHRGHAILGITSADQVKSIIYNGFFLCQMFNTFIAREPGNKNFFRGLFDKKHCWFCAALVLFIICQAIFAMAEEVLGNSPALSLKLWVACFVVGLASWILDWAGKIVSGSFLADL